MFMSAVSHVFLNISSLCEVIAFECRGGLALVAIVYTSKKVLSAAFQSALGGIEEEGTKEGLSWKSPPLLVVC